MATQHQSPATLGLVNATGAPAISTLTLNTASTFLGLGFRASGSTLSSARLFMGTVTGTLGANDITLDLYGDTNGLPNASVEGPKSPTATITATGWYDWTGFTTSLTAGTQYWLVIKNVNGTPASNNVGVRTQAGGAPLVLGANQARSGLVRLTTTTGVGGFGSATAGTGGYRVGFGDGSYVGVPFSNVAGSADLVYTARESGALFTLPANASPKVAGLAFMLGSSTGTPVGGVRGRLYSGAGAAPTLVATTDITPSGSIPGSGWYKTYFSAPQTLSGGTTYRAVLCDGTGGDSITAAYKLNEYTTDTDANSLALLPMSGTWRVTYGNPDNTSFSERNTGAFGVALLLETAGEFASVASAGVPMSRVRLGM